MIESTYIYSYIHTTKLSYNVRERELSSGEERLSIVLSTEFDLDGGQVTDKRGLQKGVFLKITA